MQNKNNIFFVPSIILAFVLLISATKQEAKWQGSIEEVNGIRVVKNPQEPLFGEFEFELEEDLRIGNDQDDNYMFYRIRGMAVDSEDNILVVDMSNFRVQVFDKNGSYKQTIGRSGQGPGEFEMPTKIRLDSSNRDIYVHDRFRAIDVFKENGDFKETITSKLFIVDFFPLDDGTIFTLVNKTSDEELSSEHVVCRMNDKGEAISSIAQFPHPSLMRRTSSGGTFSTSTGHELSVHLAAIDQNKIVFGYSKNYELNIMNRDGKLLCLVRKDDPKPKFTSKEQSEYKRIKFAVPEFKPYYYLILTDTKGRIYVQRNKAQEGIRGYGPIDKMEKEVDIFSQDGYFLYKTSLPPNTSVIKDGFLYARDLNEDDGIEYVKRYKIKNWDQIKEGI